MENYSVLGMGCAACSASVEKAVSAIEGVTKCEVNLLTNSMTVEGTAKTEDIISAVERAGFNASLITEAVPLERKSENSQVFPFFRRLIPSAVLLVALMCSSMGGFSVSSIGDRSLINGVVQMVLAMAVMLINRNFFINGLRGILRHSPNMDTLVSLGSSAGFIYSVVILITKKGQDSLYFDSSAMILVLITVGKMLEAYSKGRTTNAIKSLLKLTPLTASVIRNGIEKKIPVSEIVKGDTIIVRAGDNIPVDGEVIDGSSSVDESALTGESIPAEKSDGSSVFAGTVNTSGVIKCMATGIGEDTVLAGIVRTVTRASSSKAPVSRAADRAAAVFVPSVIIISMITFAVWLILGREIGYALSRAISVLVISCPCSLGLATPVAVMVGSGLGAKNRILFKTASALEESGKVKTVVFDKTGTITYGKPIVTDVRTFNGFSEDKVLEMASSIESMSTHPLAQAIVFESKIRGISPVKVSSFSDYPGRGVECEYQGKMLVTGNIAFVSGYVSDISPEFITQLCKDGKTPVLVAFDGKLSGIISVADEIKPESAFAVEQLKKMNIDVVLLTGDNETTASIIASKANIQSVKAGVLPLDKEKEILSLQKKGKVAMVGDGINDAPALTRADTGIAIGTGTDIAVESADVVLMGSNPADVPAAIRLSRMVMKNIRENLFWAFFYNAVCIPVAAGVFVPFGITLSPMICAAAMSLSSFCVVLNALRLRFKKIRMEDK